MQTDGLIIASGGALFNHFPLHFSIKIYTLESDDDPINMEDLLYPKEYDENLSKYVSSAIQGLLSNPNIVKNTDSLFPEDDLYSIINRAGELALRLCYDNPLTEFVPFDQSFLKDKEECLKKFYRR